MGTSGRPDARRRDVRTSGRPDVGTFGRPDVRSYPGCKLIPRFLLQLNECSVEMAPLGIEMATYVNETPVDGEFGDVDTPVEW